jgi:pimeloyl-ACP methyl ester carboxylesterase
MNESAYREAERQLWKSFGAEPKEHWVEFDGLPARVRVQEVGDPGGQPALFVHGGPNAGSTWAPIAARIPGVRALVIDRPGCGLSPAVKVADARDLPAHAVRVLAAVQDSLGLDSSDLVASSLGGAWAFWYALAKPARVRRIVQFGATALLPGQEFTGFLRLLASPLGALLVRLPAPRSVSRSVFRQAMEQMGHGALIASTGLRQEVETWSYALGRFTDTTANDRRNVKLVATWRGRRPGIGFTPEDLARVEQPTLLYFGDNDPFGGGEMASKVAFWMPNAQVEVVERGGHLTWFDDPERAIRSVHQFLTDAADDALP